VEEAKNLDNVDKMDAVCVAWRIIGRPTTSNEVKDEIY
jgi:hypothetical protein